MEMAMSFERKWRMLSPVNQKQASDFRDFLLSRKEQAAAEPRRSRIRFGIWKDEPFYIADDFDAPLDDFEEYM